ncbi:hypothetical protein, partial [Microbacterium caowuchunii]|uniref:hypothetical protein n=1 Tax=Microbacterium caowuchunii TaxID=2614638 RepID=UPI001CD71DC1
MATQRWVAISGLRAREDVEETICRRTIARRRATTTVDAPKALSARAAPTVPHEVAGPPVEPIERAMPVTTDRTDPAPTEPGRAIARIVRVPRVPVRAIVPTVPGTTGLRPETVRIVRVRKARGRVTVRIVRVRKARGRVTVRIVRVPRVPVKAIVPTVPG